uniref:SRCR domain-containing protein n=1 Tax=Octopus bimaculoides TaxID=37653 RepID=A0A0L8G3W5_OCTBM
MAMLEIVYFMCHLHRSQSSGTGNELARMSFHVPLAQVPGRSGIALPGGIYGKGNGVIWYDELNCYGIEDSIEFCKGNPRGKHDCDHIEDVSVQCYRDAITTTTSPTTTTVASATTVAPVCGKVPRLIKTKYADRAVDKISYSKLVKEDAAYGRYPWQVAVERITTYSNLHYSTEYFCGGTILHNDWIISAAHCFVYVFLHKFHQFEFL